MFVYPDPPPVLANLYGFSVKRKPVTGSRIYISVSGRETQVLTHAFPLWEFELTYDVLRTQTQNIDPYQQYSMLEEYERISTVFLACKGQYGRFFFDDHTDNSRAGEYIGTGDGTTTDFRLVRTIGESPLNFIDPIGAVNQNHDLNVYIADVEVSNYSLMSDLQTIRFTSAPAEGAVITADFYYYNRCRFLEDEQQFEEFMYNLHKIGSLRFRSTKDEDSTTPNPYFLTYAAIFGPTFEGFNYNFNGDFS